MYYVLERFYDMLVKLDKFHSLIINKNYNLLNFPIDQQLLIKN